MRLNAPTIATSIGAPRGTFQALDALRRTKGLAVTASDEAILHWQAALGRQEGLWLEPSAAASLVAVAALVEQDVILRHERVVILATAGGLKDPGRAEPMMQAVPLVPPDLDAALAAIHRAYGFDAAMAA